MCATVPHAFTTRCSAESQSASGPEPRADWPSGPSSTPNASLQVALSHPRDRGEPVMASSDVLIGLVLHYYQTPNWRLQQKYKALWDRCAMFMHQPVLSCCRTDVHGNGVHLQL